MKLGLGTVQFGMDYGISNSCGKSTKEEVCEILNIAKLHGVKVLDTAPLYGEVESALGEVTEGDDFFSVVTKTIRFNNDNILPSHVVELKATFFESLKKMRKKELYGLLIHNANDLLVRGGELLYSAMEQLKLEGFVKKIGVSVYDKEQIDRILEKYNIDIIQVPINIFDQRLVQNGYLALLKKAGIEIHARSVFLQGLLLMKPKDAIKKLPLAGEVMDKFYSHCEQANKSPLEMSLNFVVMEKHIDTVLVGVTLQRELCEILNAYSKCGFFYDYKQFFLDDLNIINPLNW